MSKTFDFESLVELLPGIGQTVSDQFYPVLSGQMGILQIPETVPGIPNGYPADSANIVCDLVATEARYE